MKEKLLIIARWIIGIVFIFSGFVKGIDPTGLQYKLTDYLEAWDLNGLLLFTCPASFLLPLIEFLIGVGLLTGVLIKLSSKLALIMMIIFTPLTLYIALKNPVTDCGCFGDALVITNWQTFYKNAILILLSLFLFINRDKLSTLIGDQHKKVVAGTFILIYSFLVFWSYRHEPIIDFRPYKVGNNITEGMKIPEGAPTDVYENTYYYQNTKTNEIKKFGDTDFPWQDTINWKFKSMDPPKLIKQGFRPPIHDFTIQTTDKSDLTDFYLQDSLYTFVVIAYDLEKSNHRKQQMLNNLANWAKGMGYHFIGLSSTAGELLEKYQQNYNPTYEIMNSDQITLKTIIRSNPGLILLHKGTVMAKWHFNDFPTLKEAEGFIKTNLSHIK